ncbi:MAG: DNA polymerase IV [Clostridia bacterium]|nr:DNA polymerase IV [Clostridia bacterium]
MARVILHADCNSFYASVECLYRPELAGKPVAVCGDPDARHGIILTKNQIAKEYGIKTGEAIWQARQKCPGLIAIKADHRKYHRFSHLTRAIYADYTPYVQPFGLDEAWLDVSDGKRTLQDGARLADDLRERVKEELGITISVGVADNKVFAKLGSDMKKPDATTLITPENFHEKVWPLPASDLLYVGPATRRKLSRLNIVSIGDLARVEPEVLRSVLGVNGLMLHSFANGLDMSPVALMGEEDEIKSVGNSTTTPHDLVNENDVKITFYMLAESVAARLREHDFSAGVVQIHVRDSELQTYGRQRVLAQPTNLSGEIARESMELFRQSYRWQKPIRSLGVCCSRLVSDKAPKQMCLFDDDSARRKKQEMERTVDNLRDRFGHFCLQRGCMLEDRSILEINPKEDCRFHAFAFQM